MVRGKAGILFKVATAVTQAPDGVVREVVFPVVDERTFQALKEAIASGTTPSRRIHTAVRASYGSYDQRMMPTLLAASRLPHHTASRLRGPSGAERRSSAFVQQPAVFFTPYGMI